MFILVVMRFLVLRYFRDYNSILLLSSSSCFYDDPHAYVFDLIEVALSGLLQSLQLAELALQGAL